MKKRTFALSIGFMSILALSNCVAAQNSAVPVAFNDTKTFMSSIRSIVALENLAAVGAYVPDVKDVNLKAVKDFQSRFNNVNHATWFSDADGFESYFIRDGYGNRVFYDQKGNWEFSLILYGENQLPRKIKAPLKSAYYDMTISLAGEVRTVDGMIYIVWLEDKSSIKILKINDQGESEILQDLVKGK
jgi:hypothetical protein